MSRFDAIVIGSGAGGAPAAARLAERFGSGVALVEAGKHYRASDFKQLERDLVPALYEKGGLQATEDALISVLQGKLVGGSTVVNDAVCFRPPEEIEARWKAYGVDVSLSELAPYVDRVEEVMHVSEIPREMINRLNYLLGLGAARLGWKGERLRHNSVGCVQCGFRHTGCAYAAKRSMNLSFVPLALERGAKLLTETRAHHLTRSAGEWTVHTDKGELRAPIVVLAAGVVNTPAILLRSGIPAGTGLQFHLSTSAWGDFEDPVDPWNGIPMSYGITEFSDVYGNTGPGYVIEGMGQQPMSFSAYSQAHGRAHEAVQRRFKYMAGCLSVLRSKARGSVTLKGERPAIDYPLIPEDVERLRHYFERITELYLAAGARRVLLAHRHTDWLDEVPVLPTMAPGSFYCSTPHPFGGANRGTVTDPEGRVRGQEGLWVLDASAIPEAIGVNPQITIAALSLQGADRILA